jgi:hypothetical protein
MVRAIDTLQRTKRVKILFYINKFLSFVQILQK